MRESDEQEQVDAERGVAEAVEAASPDTESADTDAPDVNASDVDVDAVVAVPSLSEADLAVFLAAEPLARAALTEIAPAGAIGPLVQHEVTADGAVLLQFESLTRAYTGWLWTAALARASEDSEPTVLEVELLPGEGALRSPEWRPWDERYAEYKATHDEAGAGVDDGTADVDDETADHGDDEVDEFGVDDGAVDGVDVDVALDAVAPPEEDPDGATDVP